MTVANDNVEYEHKAEYIKLWHDLEMVGDLESMVMQNKLRFDRKPQSLSNYLWFLRFETSFRSDEVLEKRMKMKVVQ